MSYEREKTKKLKTPLAEYTETTREECVVHPETGEKVCPTDGRKYVETMNAIRKLKAKK